MVRQAISQPSDRSMLAAGATLDRVLELVERSKLSATELRVLLALLNRGACLADLTEALDQRGPMRSPARAGASPCVG
jgi:DNA-binding MarR family transcriptional regulator